MNRLPVAPLALLLFVTATSPAQVPSPWRQVLPWPTDATLDGVAYGDGRFVVVGDGVALTSDDGVVWTPHALPEGVRLRDVLWTQEGFTAVGDRGLVATSRDGGTWEALEVATSDLVEVATDGRTVVAVGESYPATFAVVGGVGAASWSEVQLPELGHEIAGIAWGSGVWVIVYRHQALRSTDGLQWEVVQLPVDWVSDVVWDGARFVVLGHPSALVSRDGAEWEPLAGWPAGSFLVAGEGQLLAGSGTDEVDPDHGSPSAPGHGYAAVWRNGTWSDGALLPRSLHDAAWAEGQWFAVGFDGFVATSPDGSSWRSPWQGADGRLRALAANASNLVVVGGTITMHIEPPTADVLSSGDGVTWIERIGVDSPLQELLTDVAWVEDQWMATSLFGEVFRSDDAVTWGEAVDANFDLPCGLAGHSRTLVLLFGWVLQTYVDWQLVGELQVPGGTELLDVLWVGSRFVAVGDHLSGWSEDGLAWNFGTLGQELLRLATDGSRLVAVGRAGAGAWSADGETWTAVTTGTEANLVALTWARDRFVAGDADGNLLESMDGTAWAPAAPFPGRLTELAPLSDTLVGLSPEGRLAVRRLGDAAVPPASATRQLIPVTAHRAGFGGTEWRSDLHLTAASEDWTEVWLGLVAVGEETPEWQRGMLPPGGQLDRDDLVARGFGLDDAAGPLVVACERPLAVTSRTFTTGAGGTHGQEVAAIPEQKLAEGGTALVLPMLRQDGTSRSNVGVVNGGAEPIAVGIALFDAEGRPLGTIERQLAPLGWEQVDGILAEVGAAPTTDAYAVVSASPSTARFAAYASIIDAITGDPTYVAGLPATAEPLVVPAAGHGPGLAGTFWRSDLEVVNPGGSPAACRVELLDGSAAVELELAPGEARRHADVLALLGTEDTAALRVVPTAGEVAVTSRTYTTGGNGSFGQAVPAVLESEIGAERLVLPGLAESARFRTNLGLVNPREEDLIAVVDLFRGDGSLVGALRRPVAAHSMIGVVQAFAAFGGGESGYAVVRSEPEGSHVLAWASVVDNVSGDPVLVLGQ